MENYCVNQEEIMYKQWNDEDYLKITERQRMKLSQKEIEQTEFICWVMNHIDEDLNLYTQEDYDNENYDNVVVCDGQTLYDKIGVDILELEECFVGAYIESKWTNSVSLVVRIDGIDKSFVIDVA